MLAGIWIRVGAVGVEYCVCGGSELETRKENLAQPHIPSSTALCEINKPSPFGRQNKTAEKNSYAYCNRFGLMQFHHIRTPPPPPP